MSAGEISNAAYDRIGGVFHRALTGLTIDQLREQPSGPGEQPHRLAGMASHSHPGQELLRIAQRAGGLDG